MRVILAVWPVGAVFHFCFLSRVAAVFQWAASFPVSTPIAHPLRVENTIFGAFSFPAGPGAAASAGLFQ